MKNMVKKRGNESELKYWKHWPEMLQDTAPTEAQFSLEAFICAIQLRCSGAFRPFVDVI